jgi:hypothetical protein
LEVDAAVHPGERLRLEPVLAGELEPRGARRAGDQARLDAVAPERGAQPERPELGAARLELRYHARDDQPSPPWRP